MKKYEVILEFGEDLVYIRFVSSEPGIKVDGGVMVKKNKRYQQYTYTMLRAMGEGRKTLEYIEQTS